VGGRGQRSHPELALLDRLVEAQALLLGDAVLPRSKGDVSVRMGGHKVGNGSPS